MKLDFEKPLLNLDRKPVTDGSGAEISLHKILAGQLANASKGDAQKLMFLAQKIYDGEIVEVDKSDAEVLKNFISNSEFMTNLMKDQMLAIIDEAKTAEKAAKKLKPVDTEELPVEAN